MHIVAKIGYSSRFIGWWLMINKNYKMTPMTSDL